MFAYAASISGPSFNIKLTIFHLSKQAQKILLDGAFSARGVKLSASSYASLRHMLLSGDDSMAHSISMVQGASATMATI